MGILWVFWTGCFWQELLDVFGPWEIVHRRYTRRRRAGTWQQVLDILTHPDRSLASQLSL